MPTLKTSISVTIPPELQDMLSSWGEPLMQMLASRARTALQDHFRERDAQPSKSDAFFGSAQNKAHWWGSLIADTQIGAVTRDSASVVVGNREFALQLYGGTMRPKTAKNLAIPLIPIVRGVRAKDAIPQFKLDFFTSPVKKKTFLVHKGPGNALEFYFVLKPQVTVPADPNALPDLDALGRKLATAAVRFLSRKSAQGGATA